MSFREQERTDEDKIRQLIKVGTIFKVDSKGPSRTDHQRGIDKGKRSAAKILRFPNELTLAVRHPQLRRALFERMMQPEMIRQPGRSFEVWQNQPDAIIRHIIAACAQSTDMTLRGQTLAMFMQQLSMAHFIGQSGGKTSHSQFFGEDSIHLARQLAVMPEASLASPENCAQLLDSAIAAFTQPHYAGVWDETQQSDERNFASIIFASSIRQRMVRQWFGKDEPNKLDVLEYQAAALLEAHEPMSRNALLLFLEKKIESIDIKMLQFWINFKDPQVHEPLCQEFSTPLFDPRHPEHDRALRVVRIFLYAVGLQSLEVLAHIVATPADFANPKSFQVVCSEFRNIAAVQRLQQFIPLVTALYGNDGRQQFEFWIQRLQAVSVNPSIQQFPVCAALHRKDNLAIDRYPLSGQPPYHVRIVEAVALEQLSLPGKQLGLVEIAPETKPHWQALVAGLVHDIKHTTVALLKTSCVVEPQTRIDVKPHQPAPALTITATSDAYRVTVELDEHLELTPAPSLAHRGIAEAIRIFGLAAIHDVLTSHHIRIPDTAAPPKPQPEAGQPPSSKPTRVRRSGRFVVIGIINNVPEQEITVQDSSGADRLTLQIDTRPHWRDLAPQLTQAARNRALQQLIDEDLIPHQTNEDQQAVARLRAALMTDSAHLLTVQQIVHALLQHEQAGQRLLPVHFPIAHIIAELTQRETQLYKEELRRYQTTPGAHLPDQTIVDATQPAVTKSGKPIYKPAPAADLAAAQDVFGPTQYITKLEARMVADRLAMQKAGVEYVIPAPTRPTQTYVPFSRTRRTLPLRGDVASSDQYVVVRGQSSVEAVKRLLNIH